MKTREIIKKNIRLLLRSKVSTLVLILGPLLVIMLVGISFSTTNFNLKLGVYSDSYSDVSNSFVEKLNNGSFKVVIFETNDTCVSSVIEQDTHACIIFPPDLSVENGDQNVLRFYVDQSKVNLVYLVMSSLKSSVGEVTTDISRDLTEQIVTELFRTKTGLESSGREAEEIITKINDLETDIGTASSTLGTIDFKATGSMVGVDTYVDKVRTSIEELKTESDDFIGDMEDLMDNIEAAGGLDGNQTDDMDSLREDLDLLDALIKNKHNSSIKDLGNVITSIDKAIGDITKKLSAAQTVNTDVINKLAGVKNRADGLKEDTENLKGDINQMISSINSVQVTDIENIVSPITTEINEVVESKSNLGFLFPSLIVMLIMFIGLFLSSTIVIMEKNSSASFRVFMTPTKQWLFILSTYLTSMILILIQVAIILTVSQFYFNINFLDSFFLILLSLLSIMSFFILAGMLIGYVFNTEEMSMLCSISVASLLLITSGIVFPIESMPEYLMEAVKYNPVVAGSDVFRKSLLFDSGFTSIRQPFSYLMIASLLVLGAILLTKKLEIKRQKAAKRIKKNILAGYFDFGERKAKTLAEFIVSIQNLSEKRYAELLYEGAFRDWIYHFYKDRTLAKKLEEIKQKDKLLEILIGELKKTQKNK